MSTPTPLVDTLVSCSGPPLYFLVVAAANQFNYHSHFQTLESHVQLKAPALRMSSTISFSSATCLDLRRVALAQPRSRRAGGPRLGVRIELRLDPHRLVDLVGS